MITLGAISGFKGPYRFLSNFWPAVVSYEGVSYPTVEHAYQAAKVVGESRTGIHFCKTPGEAKTLGRKFQREGLLKPTWEADKLGIMEDLVRQKFTLHEDLRMQLLATAPVDLIETNHWGDTFWGVCRGTGNNHLGLILMRVRTEVAG